MDVWVLTTSWWSSFEGSGKEVYGVYSTKELGLKAVVSLQDQEKLDYILDFAGAVQTTWVDRKGNQEGMELTKITLDEAPQSYG